ncbi:MAG: acyl-CoA dehydratase activase [Actinomycetota bacterium]|nr:acyl-CoA dehydratase activase [Actinomycetota bacterium]
MSVVYGVDLGSRYVKVAAERGGAINLLGRYDTVDFYRRFVEPDKEGGILRRDSLALEEEAKVAATGYGRARLGRGAVMVPELEAIVEGVKALTGMDDAIILDIGGQDSKVLLLQEGRLADFAANDRCAASSGRFLENMSAVLGLELEEMGEYWERPVELSSTCAIFGETELVGLMGEGYKIEELAAGVNHAILRRLLPLLSRFEPDTLILTGGVARSKALRRLLEGARGTEPLIPGAPEFVAAVGCCRLARCQE